MRSLAFVNGAAMLCPAKQAPRR